MGTYKIADLIVQMETFGRTLAQAEPYRTEEANADMVIKSGAPILMEDNPHLTLEDCEYISTGASFYRQLANFNGMMLHSSCVVVDGKAYLFSAPCGTGKSTHVQLWLELFGDRAYILNDDKPALRVVGGKVYVYGTPWSGKYDCSRNERAELGGIAILRRAKENSIRALSAAEAIYPLLDQTARSMREKGITATMDTIGKIIETGRIFELHCNMEQSAAVLSYEFMSGKRFAL